MIRGEPRPAIVARGICKSFSTPVLKDVDLEIPAGSIHGLVGENGAGKSTLAKIIVGLERADSGSLFLDGATLSARQAGRLPEGRRCHVCAGTQPRRRFVDCGEHTAAHIDLRPGAHQAKICARASGEAA